MKNKPAEDKICKNCIHCRPKTVKRLFGGLKENYSEAKCLARSVPETEYLVSGLPPKLFYFSCNYERSHSGWGSCGKDGANYEPIK